MKKFENAEIKIVSLDHSDDILTNSYTGTPGFNPDNAGIGEVDWD